MVSCRWCYCSMEGGDPLQFCEHRIHLVCVYVIGQPGDAIACDVLAKLIDVTLRPFSVPEILVFFGVAVDHLIVADPEGDVPCCVICPSVHAVSFVCLLVCILVDVVALPMPAVPVHRLSHSRLIRQRRLSPIGWGCHLAGYARSSCHQTRPSHARSCMLCMLHRSWGYSRNPIHRSCPMLQVGRRRLVDPLFVLFLE